MTGQQPGGPAADQGGATRDHGHDRDRARRRRLAPGGDIVQAIRDAVQGALYVSPRIAHAVVQASLTHSTLPPDPLTSREREIVQGIAEGQTTQAMAVRLGLRVKTVESHRINLMRKLDMHETATLVRSAIRRGLTTP